MTVAKFAQPDASTQTGTQYKANIDASIQALMQLAANFAPHAADIPDMTVTIDAGKIWAGGNYVSAAQQITSAFIAPITNPRIDRIAIDMATGNYVVIAGTEAATPAAPAYTSKQFPICQVALSVGQSSITNSNIIDERALIQKTGTHNFGPDQYGNPIVGSFNFQSSFLAAPSTWYSVGPNGSGADIIWSGMSEVPANADWIELLGWIQLGNTAGNAAQLILYAREHGTTVGTSNAQVAGAYTNIGGATSISQGVMFRTKVPMVNNIIDLQYGSNSGDSNSFTFYISGYGYNQ